MEPIEVLWISLVLFFGVIGIVRGFLRELGVTTTVLAAIYVISEFLEGRGLMNKLLGRAGEMAPAFGAFIAEDPRISLVKFVLYLLFMAFVAFISYHGETLAFGGEPPKGLAGSLLGLMVGLLNGYLIVGTIWYYLDAFDYPIEMFELFEPPLRPFAETLRAYLLLNLIPDNLTEPALISGIVLLLFLRVIR